MKMVTLDCDRVGERLGIWRAEVVVPGRIDNSGVQPLTLSCPPRNSSTICGPTYKQYNSGHVCLDHRLVQTTEFMIR